MRTAAHEQTQVALSVRNCTQLCARCRRASPPRVAHRCAHVRAQKKEKRLLRTVAHESVRNARCAQKCAQRCAKHVFLIFAHGSVRNGAQNIFSMVLRTKVCATVRKHARRQRAHSCARLCTLSATCACSCAAVRTPCAKSAQIRLNHLKSA